MHFGFIFSFFSILHCHFVLTEDYRQAQFIRDWAAHCAEKVLPSYDAKEIGPTIRKCISQKCVFNMYKYIADSRPEFFRDFDICYEMNTAKKKPIQEVNDDQHYSK